MHGSRFVLNVVMVRPPSFVWIVQRHSLTECYLTAARWIVRLVPKLLMHRQAGMQAYEAYVTNAHAD